MPVIVRGLADVQRAFAKADKDTKRYVRAELRNVAEPVRREAGLLATTGIRNMTPAWSQMRIGGSQKVVYVAPLKRGVKTARRAARKRPNLAKLLLRRALWPALDRHESDLGRRVDEALDRMAANFNRGGIQT